MGKKKRDTNRDKENTGQNNREISEEVKIHQEQISEDEKAPSGQEEMPEDADLVQTDEKQEHKVRKTKVSDYFLMGVNFLMVLLIIFLMIPLFQIIVQKQVPKIFGYSWGAVVSGSMEPTLNIDDVIIYKDIPKDEYQVGDIVVYQGNERITHRIIEIDNRMIITQGDANPVPDESFSNVWLLGKVVFVIPKLGILTKKLASPIGMGTVIFVFLFLLFAPDLIRKRKNRAKEPD